MVNRVWLETGAVFVSPGDEKTVVPTPRPAGVKRIELVDRDFVMRLKRGKRIHLCEYEADSLSDGLNGLFNRYAEISRIKHGKRQRLNTLISEEALLLAKYLRNEKKEWQPRIVLNQK